MAGWTTPATVISFKKLLASFWNEQVRDNFIAINGYVEKTLDQSRVSSTTLVADDALFYAIPAPGTYLFEIWIYANSAANAAGDINIGFTYPAGSVFYTATGPNNAALASGSSSDGEWIFRPETDGSPSTTTAYGLSTVGICIHVMGKLIASEPGTLQLIWGQLASNANASRVLAQSYMTVKQVSQ